MEDVAPIQHTLQTLRYTLFAKPAFITHERRKPILNLAIACSSERGYKVCGMPQKPSTYPPNSSRFTRLEYL